MAASNRPLVGCVSYRKAEAGRLLTTGFSMLESAVGPRKGRGRAASVGASAAVNGLSDFWAASRSRWPTQRGTRAICASQRRPALHGVHRVLLRSTGMLRRRAARLAVIAPCEVRKSWKTDSYRRVSRTARCGDGRVRSFLADRGACALPGDGASYATGPSWKCTAERRLQPVAALRALVGGGEVRYA